eukprot:g2911.t1
MQVTTITNLDEFDGVHDALSKVRTLFVGLRVFSCDLLQAIDDAVAKKADPGRVQAAKTLRRKLLAEASLMRTVLGQQKTTVAHISMLQDTGDSESEVQKRITATAVLCEVDSFKEAEGREEMPDWSQDTEKFEDFHEAWDQISEVLMSTALEQLDKIERLLVEKKQTEAEMGLKVPILEAGGLLRRFGRRLMESTRRERIANPYEQVVWISMRSFVRSHRRLKRLFKQ